MSNAGNRPAWGKGTRMTRTRNKWVAAVVVFVIAFIVALLTKGLWSASPSDINGAPAVSQTNLQLADYEVPANGYVANGKCYVVIGQGGFSQEVPCSSFHKLPAKVRQCVGAVASTMGVGWIFELEKMFAAFLGTTAAGCVPW